MRGRTGPLLAAAIAVAGCSPTEQYISETYRGVPEQRIAHRGHVYQIKDKPADGLLLIVAEKNFPNGLFGRSLVASEYRAAAVDYLNNVRPRCRVSDTVDLTETYTSGYYSQSSGYVSTTSQGTSTFEIYYTC